MKFDEAKSRVESTVAKRRPDGLEIAGFRRAAVLVPVLSRAGEAAILFTQRTDTVREHPGQISFPGGRFESGEDARAAALRESHEEVGLEPARVATLATLDDQVSVSNYLVTPVVGFVADPPRAFAHQASEVVEPFEVSIDRLLDRANFRVERWKVENMPPRSPVEEILKHRRGRDEFDEATQTYPVFFFDGGRAGNIWGLTARILKDFLDLGFGFSG